MQINIHADTTPGESQNEVKANLDELARVLQTVVASGNTHLEMLRVS